MRPSPRTFRQVRIGRFYLRYLQDAARPVVASPASLASGVAESCMCLLNDVKSAVSVSADAVLAAVTACGKFVTAVGQASQRDTGFGESLGATSVLVRVVQVTNGRAVCAGRFHVCS